MTVIRVIKRSMPLQNIVQVMLSGIWVLSSVWRVDSTVSSPSTDSPWPSRNKTAFEHRYLSYCGHYERNHSSRWLSFGRYFCRRCFSVARMLKTIRAELGSASFGCVALHGPQSTTTKDPNWTQHLLGRQTQFVLRQRTSKMEKVECRSTFKTDPVEGRPTDIGRPHLSPVWNLGAVIWFLFPVSSLVSLSGLVLSVRSCFC